MTAPTIREHAEAILATESNSLRNLHAQAILDALDAAQHLYQCQHGCWDCIYPEAMRPSHVRIAVVPDPEPDARG